MIFSEQSLCLHHVFVEPSAFEKPCSNLLKILTASCHIAIWAASSSRSCRRCYTRPRVSVSKIVRDTLPTGLWPQSGLSAGEGPPLRLGAGSGGGSYTPTCRGIHTHVYGFPISARNREVYLCHGVSHHTSFTYHVRMTCGAHIHMP